MKVKLMAVTALVCASAVFAADVEQLKNLPRGVQSIKYENGVISTLVVVGKKAIPVALRTNPGLASEYGGESARSEAQLEFTRFLSTKCQWGKNANGETVVKDEAVAATDAAGAATAASSSSFTKTSMSKEEMAQSAQACVSGIQCLWEGVNDSGEYAWVGAWNAKALNSLKDITTKMNEVHAEVNSMAEAEKAKKAARDQNELDEIKGKKRPAAGGENANGGNAGQNGSGQVDVLNGVRKPASSVAPDAGNFL